MTVLVPMENEMAKPKKTLSTEIVCTTPEQEQGTTINVEPLKATITVSSGLSNFLDKLEEEIKALDHIAVVMNATLIKLRIEELIKKARAEM